MNTVTKTKPDVKGKILDIPWMTEEEFHGELNAPRAEVSYGNGTCGAEEWQTREPKWAKTKTLAQVARAYSREVAVRDEDDDSLMWAV